MWMAYCCIMHVYSLQGNPYCNNSKNSKDDGVRCYCEQLCFPAAGLCTNQMQIFSYQMLIMNL